MTIKRWIKEYEKVGKRKRIIWEEFLQAKRALQCWDLPLKYKKTIEEAEFLMAMFIVLLDDAVDKMQNEKLFNDLAEIPFANKKSGDSYFKLTKKVWQRLIILLKTAPCYKEALPLFEFDIQQAISAFRYDLMLSKNPSLINTKEIWLYAPHSMQFLFNTSIYLMFVGLPKNLGALRQVNWLSLKMARIGNWLYTWQREAKEGDFASWVFAYALENDALKMNDLRKRDVKKIFESVKKTDAEKKLSREWQKCYNEMRKFTGKMSLSIPRLSRGLKRLLALEASLAKKQTT